MQKSGSAADGGYFLRDVERMAAEIRQEVPWGIIEHWQDFGYRLVVQRADASFLTIVQPGRPPDGDFVGQPEIHRTAAEAITFLREDPAGRPAFIVRCQAGQEFRIWANGFARGFPVGCSIVNYIPQLLAEANREGWENGMCSPS